MDTDPGNRVVELNNDYRDMLQALSDEKARFLLVGADAVCASSVLLIALSLLIGWGIRRNFGQNTAP